VDPTFNAAVRANPGRFVEWVIAHFGMSPETWVGVRRRPASLLLRGVVPPRYDPDGRLAALAQEMRRQRWVDPSGARRREVDPNCQS